MRSGRILLMVISAVAALAAYASASPPTAPTNVRSTSHQIRKPSTETTIRFTWTAATDPEGELSGYCTNMDNKPDTNPVAKTLSPYAVKFSSSQLLDGDDWYFHIRSVDAEGLRSETVHLGPFIIDTQPGIAGINPNVGITGAPTSITITGSDFMADADVRIENDSLSNIEVAGPDKITATVPGDIPIGIYDITVINPNGKSDTRTGGFTITDKSGNHPPVPDAGPDQSVLFNTRVDLQGTATDPDEEDTVFTYQWRLIEKPGDSHAVLSDETSPAPYFTADVQGRYLLRLTVTDDGGASGEPDQVEVFAYIPGDIDGDRDVDLADGIIALEILAGIDSALRPYNADVSGNGRIDGAEAIFILQRVAGLRNR